MSVPFSGRVLRPIAVLALAAAALASTFAVATASADPLPVETLFRKPQYFDARLSPSGRYLAAVVNVGGRMDVAVLDLDTMAKPSVLRAGDGDAVGVIWQSDERLIVRAGDLNRAGSDRPVVSGMWAVDRNGDYARPVGGSLTRSGAGSAVEAPVAGEIVRVFKGTDDILMATSGYSRSGRSVDLYRLDTRKDRHELLSFDSPGFVWEWVADFDGAPRAAVTGDVRTDQAAWYVRKSADSPWQRVEQGAVNDLTSEPMVFSPDGKTLYVNARRGGDRDAIYEYAVDTGNWTGPVISHPNRDIVGRFVVDYEARKLLGFAYANDKPSVAWFDKEYADVQASVDKALPDTSNFLQHEGKRWIVTALSDRNPGDVYLLERDTMKMSKLFSYRPWIDPAQMASSRWVRYKARDGLAIPALVTEPVNRNGKAVPLVVDIHGGPYVEAANNLYDIETQFFASRGYAVIRPQFRGTSGFGRAFFEAGFRQWGDKMQDDLEDGVKWAVAEGIADPARVCYYGASYGGYAAIWETIRNPKAIACAVALAGPTSIEYLFDNAQTDMSYLADHSSELAREIGDPAKERERFRRVSPLQHADKVDAPLFLAYGTSDVRVPFAHGQDFKSALDKYGKSYEWETYASEMHGLTLDANVFDFYQRVDRFMAKYLNRHHSVEK
jgi:dipeptidyl aminopeptidase/acylaminoacyl peptidase